VFRSARPRTHPSRQNSRFAFVIGLVVAALTAADLGQDLSGTELGIERWLVPRSAVSRPEAGSFRMATSLALPLALAGSSLALGRFERHRLAPTVLSGAAGAIEMFALFSGLTGIDTLYDGVQYRVPPLLASVELLCITGGIILRTGTAPEFRIAEPLWRLLTMFGCAIVAPPLLLGAYAGFRIAESQFDQVRNNLITEAPVLSGEVDRKIIGEIERLQTLAASPSLRHGTLSSSGARLKPHWACAKAATSCSSTGACSSSREDYE
jgi:hypothetical protein